MGHGRPRRRIRKNSRLLFGETTSLGGKKRNGNTASGVLQAGLPIVEEAADVAEAEVDIGEFIAHLDGMGEIAGFGAALGHLKHDLLAEHVLAGRQMLERFLEVALRQPPVAALLEAVAEVNQGLAEKARIAAGHLQLAN